jgi:hypothetical protein
MRWKGGRSIFGSLNAVSASPESSPALRRPTVASPTAPLLRALSRQHSRIRGTAVTQFISHSINPPTRCPVAGSGGAETAALLRTPGSSVHFAEPRESRCCHARPSWPRAHHPCLVFSSRPCRGAPNRRQSPVRQECGLTLRSRRGPTARHQAREAVGHIIPGAPNSGARRH